MGGICDAGAEKSPAPFGGPRIFGAGGRTRLRICPTGQIQRYHQCLHWWQELSTGQFHCYGFESVRLLARINKRGRHRLPLLFIGAGGRTRTGTMSPSVDFESTTSTNSITPAGVLNCSVVMRFFLLRCPTNVLGFEKPSSLVDRSHSLGSLLPPQAALPSLPITPAGVG